MRRNLDWVLDMDKISDFIVDSKFCDYLYDCGEHISCIMLKGGYSIGVGVNERVSASDDTVYIIGSNFENRKAFNKGDIIAFAVTPFVPKDTFDDVYGTNNFDLFDSTRADKPFEVAHGDMKQALAACTVDEMDDLFMVAMGRSRDLETEIALYDGAIRGVVYDYGFAGDVAVVTMCSQQVVDGEVSKDELDYESFVFDANQVRLIYTPPTYVKERCLSSCIFEASEREVQKEASETKSFKTTFAGHKFIDDELTVLTSGGSVEFDTIVRSGKNAGKPYHAIVKLGDYEFKGKGGETVTTYGIHFDYDAMREYERNVREQALAKQYGYKMSDYESVKQSVLNKGAVTELEDDNLNIRDIIKYGFNRAGSVMHNVGLDESFYSQDGHTLRLEGAIVESGYEWFRDGLRIYEDGYLLVGERSRSLEPYKTRAIIDGEFDSYSSTIKYLVGRYNDVDFSKTPDKTVSMADKQVYGIVFDENQTQNDDYSL